MLELGEGGTEEGRIKRRTGEAEKGKESGVVWGGAEMEEPVLLYSRVCSPRDLPEARTLAVIFWWNVAP